MSLDQATEFVKPRSVTEDAFLGGLLTVSQPAGGFRAGLDSVLLGAAVPAGARRLLDLGAGVGTAALVALAGLPDLRATLVEIDPGLAALAEANIAGNGFSGRASVVAADLSAPGSALRAAGIAADAYDIVIANPPFFPQGRGTPAPDAVRRAARQMQAGGLSGWARAAAGAAAPGGTVMFVHVASALPELLAALAPRFGALCVLPLHPREGEPASRVLVCGTKGSRAPLRLLAGRVLHGPDGGFSPPFEAIFRGRARLLWQSDAPPPK
jgi:tRNA1(Val) A37 N6-methylase TrmN6